MKTKVILAPLLVLALIGGALAGDKVWSDNYEKAKQEARKTGKYVFIDFSGSDWCGWCQKLDKEVLSQKTFLKFADDNLVLLNLDFPKFKKQNSALKEQNEKLLKQYSVQGFPTVILLSPKGDIVDQTGYRRGGAEKYVSYLEEVIYNYENNK